MPRDEDAYPLPCAEPVRELRNPGIRCPWRSGAIPGA